MKEFEAQALINSIRSLMSTADLLPGLKTQGISSRNSGVIVNLRQHITALARCCESADLGMSRIAAERLLLLLDPHLSENAIAESLGEAVTRVAVRIEDELSLRLYFSLEPREAEFYNRPFAGWERVAERFADTTRDIEEVSKCFALCRYPAAMFHALHVAEWGAIELGKYIGVTDPKRGWGPTERRLKELIKGGHSALPVPLSGKFEFLEQMNREIDSMVLAWRHKVDHAANHLAILPNTEFTPDVAEHIISSVKVFMNRLVDGIPK